MAVRVVEGESVWRSGYGVVFIRLCKRELGDGRVGKRMGTGW